MKTKRCKNCGYLFGIQSEKVIGKGGVFCDDRCFDGYPTTIYKSIRV